tara:strand:- start:611 stop:895 length:285 start_codon:yes stop_codon:yes gene_type:complete
MSVKDDRIEEILRLEQENTELRFKLSQLESNASSVGSNEWMGEDDWRSELSVMAGSNGDELLSSQKLLLEDRRLMVAEIEKLRHFLELASAFIN